MRRSQFPYLFKRKGYKYGAEIGVNKGRFSRALCQKIDGLELLCVDAWDLVYQDKVSQRWGKEGQEECYQVAKERLAPHNCTLIKKESLDAVRDIPYESLDFVYIDGSHEFGYVMCDIIEWSKRVKAGGIVSGHDYTVPGVEAAVNIYASFYKLDLHLTSDNTPSWWFTKC